MQVMLQFLVLLQSQMATYNDKDLDTSFPEEYQHNAQSKRKQYQRQKADKEIENTYSAYQPCDEAASRNGGYSA